MTCGVATKRPPVRIRAAARSAPRCSPPADDRGPARPPVLGRAARGGRARSVVGLPGPSGLRGSRSVRREERQQVEVGVLLAPEDAPCRSDRASARVVEDARDVSAALADVDEDAGLEPSARAAPRRNSLPASWARPISMYSRRHVSRVQDRLRPDVRAEDLRILRRDLRIAVVQRREVALASRLTAARDRGLGVRRRPAAFAEITRRGARGAPSSGGSFVMARKPSNRDHGPSDRRRGFT